MPGEGTGGGGGGGIATNPLLTWPCEISATGEVDGGSCLFNDDIIARNKLIVSLISLASQQQIDWIANSADLILKEEINQFKDELSWNETSEGKDFAVEEVKVLKENPEAEVDFEELKTPEEQEAIKDLIKFIQNNW